MASMIRRIVGPSLALLRENRTMLRRALWLRLRHPRRWVEARREVAS